MEMQNNHSHVPVLLEETLTHLNVQSNGKYIDCTLGAGGHTEAILKKGGKVLGIEADASMLKFSEERLKNYCPTLVRGNFQDIEQIARENGFFNADGILMDLGISNLHYEVLGRGFSFRKSAEPLDLRLSTETQAITAATLLNLLSESQLDALFEPIVGPFKSRKIVRAIVRRRNVSSFAVVSDLAEAVGAMAPETFLALRIAVNGEFDALEKGITGAMEILKAGGILAIISFHSLEDKRVHDAFKRFAQEGKGEIVTKNPIIPSNKEVDENPKSRSALLRVIRKI